MSFCFTLSLPVSFWTGFHDSALNYIISSMSYIIDVFAFSLQLYSIFPIDQEWGLTTSKKYMYTKYICTYIVYYIYIIYIITYISCLYITGLWRRTNENLGKTCWKVKVHYKYCGLLNQCLGSLAVWRCEFYVYWLNGLDWREWYWVTGGGAERDPA